VKTCPKCSSDIDKSASFCPFCGQEAAAAPSGEVEDPFLGKVLAGNFRVEKQIGVGAMGSVYRAQQLSLNKTVAVKILHQRLVGDEHLERRFHREAQAASRLSHPNSIQILDHGTADGALFIVMEYLEGRDLGKLIREDPPLGWARICDLLAQVCAVLDEAHAAGIIHRDLKPENIMVVGRRNGGELVKVLDFGIAKVRDAAQHDGEKPLTFVGMVCGTPEYMSPEQARGVQITPRTDLYALGAILYHLLTGHVPFDGPSPLAVVTRLLTEEPVRPSERRPDLQIPTALEALCLRALAKEPDERPASAKEMREELLAIEAQLKAAVPLADCTGQLAPLSHSGGLPVGDRGMSETDPLPLLPRPAEVDGADAGELPRVARHHGEAFASAPMHLDLDLDLDLDPRRCGSPRGPVQVQASPRKHMPGHARHEGLEQTDLHAPTPVPRSSREQGSRRRRWPAVAILLLLAGLAGSGYYSWQQRQTSSPQQPVIGQITVTRGLPLSKGQADQEGTAAAAGRQDGGKDGGARIVADGGRPHPVEPSTLLSPSPGTASATSSMHPPPIRRAEKEQPAAAPVREHPAVPQPERTASSGEAHFQRGREHFLDGRLTEAIAEYQRALKLRYRNPELYYEMGRCYTRLRQLDQANQFYRLYVKNGKDPKKLRLVEAILGGAP